MTNRWSRLGPYVPWLAATVLATAGAAVLEVRGADAFDRFLGPLSPTLVVTAAGAAGLVALDRLRARGYWRRAAFARTCRGLAVATAATLPFAAVAIAADAAIGYPRDTNVTGPQAWLFYPSVALVAETVFHLLPLAALAWLSRTHLSGRAITPRAAGLIAATAAVEPAAQVALGTALPLFTAGHVYAFGVVQLVLLRRYGYVPMLWFRLCYYLLWHLLWGTARLELLF
ncbi:MAG: hypothetical protein PVH07_07240 [Chloroflexota bacterium]|jgi:hypothetical protein